MTSLSASTKTRSRRAGANHAGPELPSARQEAQHFVARVATRHGGQWQLAGVSAGVVVKRAAGCLLDAETGDTVACLRAGSTVWITAVLERAEAGATNRLSLRGPTRIEVEQGSLTLEAPDLSLTSARMSVQCDDLVVASQEACLQGARLQVLGTTVQMVGQLLSTVFERVLHYSKNHLRTTDGLDRVQATHVECQAEQLMRLDGEHVLVSGERLVKARGAQIHFG